MTKGGRSVDVLFRSMAPDCSDRGDIVPLMWYTDY